MSIVEHQPPPSPHQRPATTAQPWAQHAHPYPSQAPSHAAKKKTPVAAVVMVSILLVGLFASAIWVFFVQAMGELEGQVERVVLACSEASNGESCTAASGGPQHFALPVPFPDGLKEVDASAFCRKNNQASIRGTLNFETKTVPFTAEFRKSDGEWKLLMLGPSGPSACDSM